MAKRIEVKYLHPLRFGCWPASKIRSSASRLSFLRLDTFFRSQSPGGGLGPEQGKILLVQRGCNPLSRLVDFARRFCQCGRSPRYRPLGGNVWKTTGLNVRITRILDICSGREHEGGRISSSCSNV